MHFENHHWMGKVIMIPQRLDGYRLATKVPIDHIDPVHHHVLAQDDEFDGFHTSVLLESLQCGPPSNTHSHMNVLICDDVDVVVALREPHVAVIVVLM